MTAAKADVLEQMLIGVAEVDLRGAARPEEILQEFQWKAQAAFGPSGKRHRLLCRNVGHGGYPSEVFAGMAGSCDQTGKEKVACPETAPKRSENFGNVRKGRRVCGRVPRFGRRIPSEEGPRPALKGQSSSFVFALATRASRS